MLLSTLMLASLLSQDVRPVVDQVRLVDGARILAPIAKHDLALNEHECGDGTLRIFADRLEFTRATKLAWKLDGLDPKLGFCTFGKSSAYFLGGDSPAQIKRVDLASGKWLSPWNVEGESFGGASATNTSTSVVAMLCTDTALFGLQIDGVATEVGDSQLTSYCVSRIDPSTGKSIWSRVFDAIPQADGPRAFLMAPMQNAPWHASTSPLTALGDSVVVCVGRGDPLLRLNAEDGKTLWQLDRLWEFQRGYVGPSMWQHFMGRLGFDSWEMRALQEELANPQRREEASTRFQAARTAFEAQWNGAIVAGPWIVDGKGLFDQPSKRLLVVSVLAPKTEWSTQLGAMSVYEIDEDGVPATVIALPRPIAGRQFLRFEDRIVLPCSNASFACITSAPSDSGMNGFPGAGSDCLGHIAWFKELEPPVIRAWASSDAASDACAMSPTLCVRVAGGGWVEKPDSKLFHFPLHLLDPKSGDSRLVDLQVPFEGVLTPPETNFRGNDAGFHTWGWYGLALVGLKISGEQLTVSLANSQESWQVGFDLP